MLHKNALSSVYQFQTGQREKTQLRPGLEKNGSIITYFGICHANLDVG